MAASLPVSLCVGFDAAGNPASITVTGQVTLAAGVAGQVSSATYPLTIADKAALTLLWGNIKATLGFP